jgi:asparagine synthase (glutamine-hydrolysing)
MLDHTVVEKVMAIPSTYKLRFFNPKYILKKIVNQKLPVEILKRKKRGFSVPIESWFKNELKEYFLEVILNPLDELKEIFDYEYIEIQYKNLIDGNDNFKQVLWNVLVFDVWYRTWHKG